MQWNVNLRLSQKTHQGDQLIYSTNIKSSLQKPGCFLHSNVRSKFDEVVKIQEVGKLQVGTGLLI